jgi:hypothetical protein
MYKIFKKSLNYVYTIPWVDCTEEQEFGRKFLNNVYHKRGKSPIENEAFANLAGALPRTTTLQQYYNNIHTQKEHTTNNNNTQRLETKNHGGGEEEELRDTYRRSGTVVVGEGRSVCVSSRLHRAPHK